MCAEDEELGAKQKASAERHDEYRRRPGRVGHPKEEEHQCERRDEHAHRRESASQTEKEVRVIHVLRNTLCVDDAMSSPETSSRS